jgi:hypothetical protein
MTKPMTILMAVVFTAIITACGSMRKVDLSQVSIGMSKAEVQTALRKKPDNIVAAKHFTDPEANVEILRYSDPSAESYYLYFVNNKLDKWHLVKPNEPTPNLNYYNFNK